MRTNNLLIRAVVGWLLLTGAARPAGADIAGVIYEDAKAIIEELLTDEIAQAIVPNTVCYAGHLKISDPNKAIEPHEIILKGERYGLDALFYYPQTLQRIYTRQFSDLRSIAIEESGDLAGVQLVKALTDRTDKTVAKLGPPDPKKAERYEKIYGEKIYGGFGDQQAACVDEVKKKFANKEFAIPRPSALDRECIEPDDPAQRTDSHRFVCELGFALRAAIRKQDAAAQDHLLKGLSILIASALNRAAPLVPADKIVPVKERTILMLRELVTKENSEGVITAYLAELQRVLAPKPPNEIKAAFDVIASAIDRVRTQWRIISRGTGVVELAPFIEILAASGGSLSELCNSTTTGACEAIVEIKALLGKGRLMWPIIRAASNKRYAESASVALRAIFDEAVAKGCTSQQDPGKKCEQDAFRDFLTSFVHYLVEASETGTPTDITRAALRAAAMQAIRSVAVGGGFDRRGWHLTKRYIPTPGRGFVYPELGLRASWSQSNINRTDRSIRYAVSMNLLTFKPLLRYDDRVYAAVHFSVLDPLSPFAELANRKAEGVTYQNEGKLWWNVIIPRLELLFGLPTLSKHLVVGAGVGLRLFTPVKQGTQDSSMYRYTPLSWNWPEAAQHVELGFVAKYIL